MKPLLLSLAVTFTVIATVLLPATALGQIDCDDLPPSPLTEPPEVFEACRTDTRSVENSTLAPTDAFYVWEYRTIHGLYTGVLSTADVVAQLYSDANTRNNFGCDFPVNDFTELYCIEDDSRSFYSYNTTTGAETPINFGGTSPVGVSDIWTGMATDPTTGTAYASSTTGTTSDIYTIDLNTGFVTHIAAIDSPMIAIDIAFDLTGQLYTHDIVDDAIWKIDKVTGAATFVGLTGINATFAQGMDLDENDGTIYAAAYTGGGDATLSTVNKLTGVFVPITLIGSSFPAVGMEVEIVVAADNDVLPVELSDFSAVATGDRIRLEWTTASELNNTGFDVLISSDGDRFMSRGFVEGAGTTDEPQRYSFDTDILNPGRNFVRLKQIDFDGTFEYSEILEVSTEVPDGISLYPAYPNPFNPATAIRFVVEQEMPVTLDVFDAQGRHVTNLFDGTAPARTLQSVTFDASGMPGGVYLYRLTTPTGTRIESVLLLK